MKLFLKFLSHAAVFVLGVIFTLAQYNSVNVTDNKIQVTIDSSKVPQVWPVHVSGNFDMHYTGDTAYCKLMKLSGFTCVELLADTTAIYDYLRFVNEHNGRLNPPDGYFEKKFN